MTVFGQAEHLNVADYVRVNDIGIKIIHKKKLKKDIDKLDLSKADKKRLESRLKAEEKDLKASLKQFNKVVYAERRANEFALRTGQVDSSKANSLEQSDDILIAKRSDKVFDLLESELEEEEALEAKKDTIPEHPIRPNKRSQYPWNQDVEKIFCPWKIKYIDAFERDTLLHSPNHLIYHNGKKEVDIATGEMQLQVLKENRRYYFEIQLDLDLQEAKQAYQFSEHTKLVFQLKDKLKTQVSFLFSGYSQVAQTTSDFSKQNISGRFLISKPKAQQLVEAKWTSIQLQFLGQTQVFLLSKNFTSKAEKSDISSLYKPFLECLSQ